MRIQLPVNPQQALVSVFAAMLTLSLACSMAIRAGHADVPVAATADEIEPLRAGDAAPRFAVETVEGEAFDFDPRRLERPVVVIAFRGGWCPYCNMHLSELRHVVPELDALGVDVLFLSGDRPDLLYTTLDEDTRREIDGLGFTILSDANATAAVAFGIAFRAPEKTVRRRHEKGQDIEASSMALHGILPVPSVFAIDTDGQIRFAYSNADYKVRLPANELRDAATAMLDR
jgi:peroxiredoxin